MWASSVTPSPVAYNVRIVPQGAGRSRNSATILVRRHWPHSRRCRRRLGVASGTTSWSVQRAAGGGKQRGNGSRLRRRGKFRVEVDHGGQTLRKPQTSPERVFLGDCADQFISAMSRKHTRSFMQGTVRRQARERLHPGGPDFLHRIPALRLPERWLRGGLNSWRIPRPSCWYWRRSWSSAIVKRPATASVWHSCR